MAPFASSPFGTLGRTRSTPYSWFDALGSFLLAMSGLRIYAYEVPQKIGLGDCARWRLVSQDRAGDISGESLQATTTTIEIESRSLVKKNAYLMDRSIMNAIDRRSLAWRGHRIAAVLHDEVLTDREDVAGRWAYTYTSRYIIHHYL